MPGNCCRTGNCPSLLSQSFVCVSARKPPSFCAKFSRCCVHVPKQRESLSKNIYLPCSPRHHIILGENAFLATIEYVCICLSLRHFMFKKKKRFVYAVVWNGTCDSASETLYTMEAGRWRFSKAAQTLSQESDCKILGMKGTWLT